MQPTYSICSQGRNTQPGRLQILIFSLLITLCLFVVHKFGLTVLGLIGGFLAALITLPITFYRSVVVPIVRGVQCPKCGRWALVRVACISFGFRFYRCDYCGQRCKRTDPESPWFDASGKEDDDIYELNRLAEFE